MRPKTAWIVLGDRCVRLGASGLEFLFCGLRVRFRVSRREPLPQYRGQRFGTCSVGAQSTVMLKMPWPLTRNYSFGCVVTPRTTPVAGQSRFYNLTTFKSLLSFMKCPKSTIFFSFNSTELCSRCFHFYFVAALFAAGFSAS